MAGRRSEFLTLVMLWASLALAFAIAVNRIDDIAIQVVLSVLYGTAVYAITRVINRRHH